MKYTAVLKFSSLVIMLLVTIGCKSEPTSSPDIRFEQLTFTSNQKDAHAAVILPSQYDPSKKWPLIIYLHGSGGSGQDASLEFVKQQPFWPAIAEYQADFPAIVLMPRIQGGKVWAPMPYDPIQTKWRLETLGKEPIPDMADYVTAAIKATLDTYHIDKSRVSLTGYSMGGEGAVRYGALNSDTFSAVAVVAGAAAIVAADAPQLAKFPFWMVQGSRDSLSTNELARKLVSEVKAAGGEVKYQEFAFKAHNVADKLYQEPSFIDWLVAQKKPKS